MLIVSRGTDNPYSPAPVSNSGFPEARKIVPSAKTAVCRSETPMEYLRDFHEFAGLCFESIIPVILILMLIGLAVFL